MLKMWIYIKFSLSMHQECIHVWSPAQGKEFRSIPVIPGLPMQDVRVFLTPWGFLKPHWTVSLSQVVIEGSSGETCLPLCPTVALLPFISGEQQPVQRLNTSTYMKARDGSGYECVWKFNKCWHVQKEEEIK